jgi:hypothetical protein
MAAAGTVDFLIGLGDHLGLGEAAGPEGLLLGISAS